MNKFQKILVANRGEIAVRVMRTAQRLGYTTVAVYSDADADAPHTLLADEALNIGESAPSQSYLVIDKIIAAAKAVNAGAIHPGYGFLSENADFAERCAQEDLVFIGPTAAAIRLMGSKRLSKLAMLDSNVPCIPGYQGAEQDDHVLITQAKTVGFPLMVKASAGGGGRGMRIVHEQKDLAAAIGAARAEARSAFGNDELILERAVIEPRHIEIQVFGDEHGNYVHLGERDCSIQRRHQKVVEESPSPFVDAVLREKMGTAAINAAKSCNYVGAGTVEFLVDKEGQFFFLEMNTRLQVEHPVTEIVTGLDLVEWQIKVADGLALPLRQEQITFTGHAVEVRLCAEDPRANFMPQTGEVAQFRFPDYTSLRVDAGIREGQIISPFYDSMLAKVIGSGEDRASAIRALRAGLSGTSLLGVHSNKHFLHHVLGKKRFVDGQATTAFLAEEFADAHYQDSAVLTHTLAIAAGLFYLKAKARFNYPSVVWSSAEPLAYTLVLGLDPGQHHVKSQQTIKLWATGANLFAARVGDSNAQVEFALEVPGDSPDLARRCRVQIGDIKQSLSFAFSQQPQGHCDKLYLDDTRGHWIISDETYLPATTVLADGDAQVRAAMDGAIVELKVAVGDSVDQGDVVAVLEAMKMAHQLKAGVPGVVQEILVEVGQQVKTRQTVVVITPHDEGA